MQRFPADFLWGASTAANQYEGGWDQGGRGMALTDVLTSGKTNRQVTWIDKYGNTHASNAIDFKLPDKAQYTILADRDYPNHEGSDFYHHWKEDIELYGRLGLKSFLLTISWSRIFPKGIEEDPNPDGISFYRQIFEELHKYGIKPIVTLWHSDTPLYLSEKLGGWSNREMIGHYLHYAKTCFAAYKDLVDTWFTFSEINAPIAALDFDTEEFDPQVWKDAWQATHNMLVASAMAVKAGHEINPNNRIGGIIQAEVTYPATTDPRDQLLARQIWECDNFLAGDVMVKGEYPNFAPRHWKAHMAIPEITEQDREILKEGIIDFYGLTYYHSHVISHNAPHKVRENSQITPDLNGIVYDPVGLRNFMIAAYDRYNLPMLVVENGLGTADTLEDGEVHDPYRIKYLDQHIDQVAQAIQDGIPVIGYMVWSAADLVSNATGERDRRYGLIYTDMEDGGKRYPKDSYWWYQKMIANNGEKAEQ